MNKYLIAMLGGTLLLAQTAGAAPARLLGPDATGRPQIKIEEDGKYYIFHSFDGFDAPCDPAFYVEIPKGSDGIRWCRTINRYAKNTTLSDPVPFVATVLNSPIEIEYRVGTSSDIASSQYVGWSPKKTGVSANRIQTWLQSVESRYAVQFQTAPATLAGQVTTSSDMGAMQVAGVAWPAGSVNGEDFSAGSASWYLYYNNKYIALFNHKGGLIALTHTAYGDDMIDPLGRSRISARFGEQRAFLLNVLNGDGIETTFSPETMSATPTIDSADGSLLMQWTMTNNNASVDWLLTSRSSKFQPSGLAGHANVQHTGSTVLNEPRGLYFPLVFGLTTGASKQLYVPAQNSGTVITSRNELEDGAAAELGSIYPSPGWQSQFIAVTTTANDAMLISANDPDQLVKAFSALDLQKPDDQVPDVSAGRTQFTFFTQNGNTKTIDTNGNVTLSPMHGDWAAAATKYRNWAVQQKWGADNISVMKTTAQKDIEPSLAKGVYWWSERVGEPNGLLRPSSFETDAELQKDLIGPTSIGGEVATGFHLAGWWDKAFDTSYPQFNAIEDGTPPTYPYWVKKPTPAPTVAKTWFEAIAAVQLDGSPVVPYINAVGIDMSDAPNDVVDGIKRDAGRQGCTTPVDTSGNGWWSHDFPFMGGSYDLKDGEEVGILRQRNTGVPFSESFGSDCRTFAFADPTLHFWRMVLALNVYDVFNNMGSKGIYLDSFGHANDFYDRQAHPETLDLVDEEFSQSGVPEGRGAWVKVGYRGMGAAAQESTRINSSSPRRFIAAEFFSEVVLPFTDIVMDYHDPKPNELPIIQTTYGDYQLFAGQRPQYKASFVTKKAVVGRSFLWGNQMGLAWHKHYCRFYTFDPIPQASCEDIDSQDLIAYTRTLAQAREAVQDISIGLEWSKAKFIGMRDGVGTGFEYKSISGGRQDDWCYGLLSACPATVPQLRGALWSSAGTDEPDFLVLTNTSGSDKTASFPLPLSWASMNLVHGSADVDGTEITLSGSSVAVFKAVPVTSVNIDGDLLPDATDPDDDNDGVPDSQDKFPRDESASVDADNNGKPDAWNSGCDAECQAGSQLTLDADGDHDGVVNGADNCPAVANATQTDVDSNGVGDICQHGLTVSYFNDSDTNGVDGITALDYKLVPPAVSQRIEPNVNFNYGNGFGPGSGVNADYFSARFTGRLIVPAYTGVYTFCLKGDDGIRLWINNVNLLQNAYWRAMDSETGCGNMFLLAGQSVPIKVEFFDLLEDAIMELKWSWSGHAAEVIPSSSFYAQ
jgi:hypothetical protein